MSTKPRSRRAPSTEPEEGDPTAPGEAAKRARTAKRLARTATSTARPKQPPKSAHKATTPQQPVKSPRQSTTPKQPAKNGNDSGTSEQPAKAKQPAKNGNDSGSPEQPAKQLVRVAASSLDTGLGLRPERAWAARAASNAPTLAAEPPRATSSAPEAVRALVVSSDVAPARPGAPDPPPARPVARRPEPTPHDQRQRVGWREPPTLPRGVLTRGTGLVAGLLIVFVLLGQGSDRPGAEPTAPTAQETRELDVRGETTLQATFDDLPMDSELPDPWTVSGRGTAAIVALPTSVDRSVRLAADASGAPVTACMPVGGIRAPEVTITVGYHLGRAPASSVTLLSLEAGGARTLALLIDPTGMPVGVSSPGGPSGVINAPTSAPTQALGAASADWHRVELTVAKGSGEVTWSVQDASGQVTGSGWGEVGGERGAARLETLCVHSPEGEPSGWIAIDDISVD